MGSQSDAIERTTAAATGAEWQRRLAGIAGALVLYESLSGLLIYLLPFSAFGQINVIVHTVFGFVFLGPVTWYTLRHWSIRRRGNVTHHQITGYVAVGLLGVCLVSGLVVTFQGATGPRMSDGWSLTHLLSGVGFFLFTGVHLATVIVRRVRAKSLSNQLRRARALYYRRSLIGACGVFFVSAIWTFLAPGGIPIQAFPADYNWRFGPERPFAPSLARVSDYGASQSDLHESLALFEPSTRALIQSRLEEPNLSGGGPLERINDFAMELDASPEILATLASIRAEAESRIERSGAIDPVVLAGSDGCATSGCHTQIYEEWLPSAHRYSSLDEMFQRVQTIMASETSPEQTRYCAGCHDPISLFSGAKNASNVTLSAEGAHEGISCLTCHSIVQTDVQGNADYTIEPQRRYLFEHADDRVASFLGDFLIRTYPDHHVRSYSRALYKTPEFCGACHKQYMDREINTDIGKVQGQNQYDSWKNSRWHNEGDPSRTISCRECHMPLVPSTDPARGDVVDRNRTASDRMHRSHRTLGSNQYIPVLQDLPGAEEHVRLTEQWLRGEIEIPEIADRWTVGSVVELAVAAPAVARPGDTVSVQIALYNNKTGHDFPTGPLDMIESWVEVIIRDDAGEVLHHSGGLDESGGVVDPPVVFKAAGFDRQGALIDRHNLWDLVGASYKRSLYPGMTDSAEIAFQCPSMARGRLSPDEPDASGIRTEELLVTADESHEALTIEAHLWYRKANPEFLDRVYGADASIRSPATKISSASTRVQIAPHAEAPTQ